MELEFSRGRKLRLIQGDITRIAVDAIVNAANSALRGGGGVDGAIHRAGGPAIMKELDEIRRNSGSCPTGSAVATTAGALPAEWVFHAVGPIYHGGGHGEPELLRSCYETCLRLAEERGVRAISFPAISTGVYGYPMREAAEIAIKAAGEHLLAGNTGVREIVLVLAGEEAYRHHAAALAARFGERLE